MKKLFIRLITTVTLLPFLVSINSVYVCAWYSLSLCITLYPQPKAYPRPSSTNTPDSGREFHSAGGAVSFPALDLDPAWTGETTEVLSVGRDWVWVRRVGIKCGLFPLRLRVRLWGEAAVSGLLQHLHENCSDDDTIFENLDPEGFPPLNT